MGLGVERCLAHSAERAFYRCFQFSAFRFYRTVSFSTQRKRKAFSGKQRTTRSWGAICRISSSHRLMLHWKKRATGLLKTTRSPENRTTFMPKPHRNTFSFILHRDLLDVHSAFVFTDSLLCYNVQHAPYELSGCLSTVSCNLRLISLVDKHCIFKIWRKFLFSPTCWLC